MRWLTNGLKREDTKYIRYLQAGHACKRHVVVGAPQQTACYTVEDLESMGFQGYYEVSPCQCDFCKETRSEKYYKPLEDWREMNEDTLKQKEDARREEIRARHTYQPATHRITMGVGEDADTRRRLSAFIGEVVATAEYSRMLGYAMKIKRSESCGKVNYDVIVDVDVATTIEIALTEVMGTIHTLASESGLIGKGLNIINMAQRS